ncbi:MAG: lipopolysaccharide kinase InaA family protein [Clostridia bacterium]|nr:lipopolysaccharide kinase InaA family protein [Clostridia bacterium]
MVINGYTLSTELQNANSGFSKWGYAVKNGKEYFIKELISPVYPVDSTILSPDMFRGKREYCMQFENRFTRFYGRINDASRGNLVRIEDFFRFGARYYLVTEKVQGSITSMKGIAALSDDKKLLLLKTVAHCFNDLHSAGIVHFDVKPNNIMIKRTLNGNYSAKLIDFDSGFFKGEVLENEELGGDLTYLAPETFLGIYGEDVTPDEKADIFALGLVFHQYWCGDLPGYDKSEYEYPYEAVLDTGSLDIEWGMMPEEIGKLIVSMLDAKPESRPSAKDIIIKLNELDNQESVFETVEELQPEKETLENVEVHTDIRGEDWFSMAGDL